MTINTQELYRQKQVQFGAGSSPARFTADFLTALKRAQRDMATRSGVSSDYITNVYEDVDMDNAYEPYLGAVLDFHLLSLGHNPGTDIGVAGALRMDALRDAQMHNWENDITVATRLDIDS